MIKLQGFPTPSFPFCTTVKTENSQFSPRPFDQTPRVFHLRVFGLRYSAKTKPRSWKNSEFDQNALRLVYIDQNDLDQSIILLRARSNCTIKLKNIVVLVNLRENSEFSVLSMVQKGKLGVGNP